MRTDTGVFLPPEPDQARGFFSRIARRYDFLNGFLSFGLDGVWRDWAVRRVLNGRETSILDVGTGTGKFLNAFTKRQVFKKKCGMDFCGEMLELAKRRSRDPSILWLKADAARGIPFRAGSYDVIAAAFALRSISSLKIFFQETIRVLKSGGKLVLLELTRPRSRGFKNLYSVYLKGYLPAVGALFSGARDAYSFLSDSVSRFYEPEEIRAQIEEAGFAGTEVFPCSGGIVTLISGVKKHED
ncbi:MAG TPA: ubiquinone/menaquinone biosynthesis methyltransferase [Candidatus Omnitrophota bacterium]|nr:ubiquinone/menaquinone biosynthesis methyltransferase [Candidatus Omnitrophota bacterium]